MNKLAIALSLLVAPLAAHADSIVRGSQTVKVSYANTTQKGAVSLAAMNHFITTTNTLLASKGLSVANGMKGVKEVTPQGVKVDLIGQNGKKATGLVTTELMSTNVAIAPQNAPWNLTAATQVRIAK